MPRTLTQKVTLFAVAFLIFIVIGAALAMYNVVVNTVFADGYQQRALHTVVPTTTC